MVTLGHFLFIFSMFADETMFQQREKEATDDDAILAQRASLVIKATLMGIFDHFVFALFLRTRVSRWSRLSSAVGRPL